MNRWHSKYYIPDLLDNDPPLCAQCSGSGEGMYDGAVCGRCKGSGVARSEDAQDYEDYCSDRADALKDAAERDDEAL
jgi:hypothetical protein